MSLTAEQILAADDLKRELVPTPEWGGEVFVVTMTGEERDAFEASCVNGSGGKPDLANFRAKLAARTVCDDNGKLLFTQAEVTALGKKSCSPLDRIADVAARLNYLGEKDVDALVKNSDGAPSADSG